MDLFSAEKTLLHLPNAEVIYIPNFYDARTADAYFDHFKANSPWQQDDIKIFGKIYAQPRLTALYAINTTPYSYSNLTLIPNKMSDELLQIKNDVEDISAHHFTTVLLNRYRDGSDSNGWHADNEKILGINPVIASLSFGATRAFHFKHRTIKKEQYKLHLDHGSLLIMKGEMQHFWLHQIPKTKKVVKERINLTFRSL
ncbi:alpha-ketoglutarate-dependent dioxygenase AlkB [Gelidibacter salicanalis]|uniref:Alpha-ketoglutarate-dependent dioxygenase AlkB n=1 Tax=Gelidibacter salicanalis TaxID=291193 RepID=A0A5C7ALH1_9FLAO|nr:alpha-ketoglutarate-dependent dioxygenase AlkB [Gelidibacter salicanalis]TXE09438.1 alpha-ketoglutarate-dependent dioxygenase AlkB [Gelidibacter salicanalis]